jgi:hypothetical protein
MFSYMMIALGVDRTRMNCDYVKGVVNLAILHKRMLKSLDLIHVFHMHRGYPTWKVKRCSDPPNKNKIYPQD